ncbi:MAG: hypothetical protein HYV17_13730 [Xanthomonadales bacterium]|nr:hypothetical protein [Xanthomonadales bacterium]
MLAALGRVVVAWMLLLPLVAQAAAQWSTADVPGAQPALIQVQAGEAEALVRAAQTQALGWSHVNWRDAALDRVGLERLLARSERVDRSQLVLMGGGTRASALLALSAQLLRLPNPPARLRGLVLQVEATGAWPSLPKSNDWPALLLSYRRDDAQARRAAFALARNARAAGAAVWLQPREAAASAADADLLPGWLATLGIARVRRFEDALVRSYPAASKRSIETALLALAQQLHDAAGAGKSLQVHVSDRQGGAFELLVDADARLLRRDGRGVVAEFDAQQALRSVYGDLLASPRIDLAAAQPLLHPETGSTLLAIPVRLELAGGSIGVLLLRHADGSYGMIDLGDGGALEALLPSPEAADRGHAWWGLRAQADADGHRLTRIELQPVLPRRGLWWDPSHAGSALDLQPVPGGYSAVFATYDEAGASRWYLATGRIEGQRFVSAAGGLQLMRRDPAMAPPHPDRALGGRIDIDFSVAAEHPACKRRSAGAAQLALLSVQLPGRTESWCIEPVGLLAGVPEHDVNGVWYGGSGDSGWGLSVVSAGDEGRGLVSAMLYFHDREGWPRWAMGAGALGVDGATLTMHGYSQRCRDCRNPETTAQALGELRLRVGGWCGEPELRARLELGDGDPGLRFQRPEMPLQRISESRCD